MKLVRSLSVLLASALTYSSVHAHDLVKLDDFPKWFQDAMKREIKIDATTSLEIEQFKVNGKVLGEAKLADKGDSYWYYVIDIGTNSPVECYVFTDFDGPANSLHSIVTHSLTSAEKINKKTLASSFNYAVDVGAIQNTPYLLLDTLYTLGEGNARVTGVIKALTAQTDSGLQICLHNEVGYRTSFSNVFTSFVNAFLESEENNAFFEPIYKMVFNGMPVGFGHEKYTVDSDGDVEIYTKSSMLLPVDASNVSRTDSVNRSWSSPDGALINANEHTVENGVLASHFSIGMKDDKWHVSGEMQGKAIEVDLEYNEWLLSGYGSYLATVELMNSESTTSNYQMWLSDADPTTATAVGLSETSDSEEGNIQIDMGPMVFKFLAEENGTIQKGSMEQGPVKMQLELLKVKGTPAIQ